MKIIFGAKSAGGEIRINQCPCCLRVFGGIKGFERHRVGFRCVDPATAGMSVTAVRIFETANGAQSFPVWSRGARGLVTSTTTAAEAAPV